MNFVFVVGQGRSAALRSPKGGAFREFAAINSIPSFAHMRPNCVMGSSPRSRSFGVAARLYR
ncbi:MAG TPA: hypothetical protein VJS43_15265, partial [Candidatus Acidoferrales bacterium]|nr:hypothetical protein [Candidatus Acidoferrales bacterium]